MMDSPGDPASIDFDAFPDSDVEWMGVPYPQSKLVDGVWYLRKLDGQYVRFLFQDRVRNIAEREEI